MLNAPTPRSDRARAALNRYAWRTYAADDPRAHAPPASPWPEVPRTHIDFRTACPGCGRLHYTDPHYGRANGYVAVCDPCGTRAVRALAAECRRPQE